MMIDNAVLVARILGLSTYKILLRIGVTDLDVVGFRGNELVTVEVKRRLHEQNFARALLQLLFRSMISDRVYIAVPARDAAIALALPEEFGVIAISATTASIVRDSARFKPPTAYKLPIVMEVMGSALS